MSRDSSTGGVQPVRAVALVATLAGLGVSVYLTVEHFTHGASFACPESATVNCLKVTTSQWSVIAGVPVAVLGLVFFVAMLVLLAVPDRYAVIGWTRIAGATVGIGMALYLVYVELFDVDAICLWCTAVHVLTLVLFGAVLTLRPHSD